jgi:AraC-like DNA-binding protein
MPVEIDEILIRLLRSPVGGRIAQMGQLDSSLHRVAKAVSTIRESYDRSLDVDALARLVNMSISTFHRQFRAVTAMSPCNSRRISAFRKHRG